MREANERDEGRDRREEREEREGRLDPHRREARESASAEVAARLRDRGVTLAGRESSEELVTLLDAVERFESAVQDLGGDLMVDEAPRGRAGEPDDPRFVLPRRRGGESATAYAARIDEAATQLRGG